MTPTRAAEAVVTTRNLVIPTRAGSFLRGDLYRSAANVSSRKRLPTIVIYFPYNKDDSSRFERPFLERAAMRGFAALLVDIAGTGASPGAFTLLSEQERLDGYDVVEWSARQRWSTGRVGMFGYSYPGITAAMVATLQPPHLEAIVPAAAFNDAYRDIMYPGGIRASQDAVALGALFSTAVPFVRVKDETAPDQIVSNTADAASHPQGLAPIADVALHPLYDGWWKERALENRADRIRVPALFWTGWDDVYPRGEPMNYAQASSKDKALVIGPWGHLGGTGDQAYEFLMQDALRWFDTYLRGNDRSKRRPRAGLPAVRLFDVDRTSSALFDGTWRGQWRSFDTWPPRHETRTLHLCATPAPRDATTPWPTLASLATDCHADGSVAVAGVPLELTGGVSVAHDGAKNANANGLNDPKDQRSNLAAAAFVGPPLDKALMVTGPLEADLWATTDGADTGWVARVVDIGPDAAQVLAQGWLKASHRREDPNRPFLWHTHDAEVPVVPSEPYRLRIEVWPTSYRVPAGHRLGLILQAADTMKVSPGATAPTSQILTGPRYPSRLLVPGRTVAGLRYSPLGASAP